ncbi:MAG: DUF58 domain-containing protein [Pirellulaceae bacterium]
MSFDARFQQQCESLHHQAARVWGRNFLGRRTQWTLAGGTEVTGYSDYSVGDDPRYIDWNLCARHDELRVKQFQGSEDNRVYLVLDVSRSMSPSGSEKFAFARRLTAALGYLALANLDRVGVLAVSDRIVSRFPAVRGRSHLPRLLAMLENLTVDQAATNLRAGCEAVTREGPRGGLAVLISDLIDPAGLEPALDTLRVRGFEPHLVHVVDPRETEWTATGPVALVDAESGRVVRTTLTPRDVANYRNVCHESVDALKRYCGRWWISYVQVRCDAPIENAVYQMFGVAKSRMASLHARQ